MTRSSAMLLQFTPIHPSQFNSAMLMFLLQLGEFNGNYSDLRNELLEVTIEAWKPETLRFSCEYLYFLRIVPKGKKYGFYLEVTYRFRCANFTANCGTIFSTS